jgi:hypothetical protein
MKVGDLVKFKHDGQLMLITHEQRPGVFDGVFVCGPRHGNGVSSYANLMCHMEKVNESR